MRVKPMILDGKSETGKRMSVSIDDALCDFVIDALGKKSIREWARELMQVGIIRDSKTARREAYKLVIKPSLLKADALEQQTDIEDY